MATNRTSSGTARLRGTILIGLALIVLLAWAGVRMNRARAGSPPVDLDYTVSVIDAAAERLSVELTLSGLDQAPIYLGFSANAVAHDAPVRKFRLRRAETKDGRDLHVTRERGLWRVDRPEPWVQVTYEVYLREGRPQNEFAAETLSRCDAGGARLLGSDVFLFPSQREVASISASYRLPEDWALIHPFQTGPTDAVYPDLKSLYYSVVAAGDYRTLTRSVSGMELTLAIRGQFQFGDRDLMQTASRICAHQVEFFGRAPRERFLIVVDPHPDGGDPEQLHYFGLHFDGSMSVQLDERTDRRRLHAEPAHILAHEFFHNWNGELIGQDGYAMNWFIEGVTTYYSYQTRLALRMLDNGRYARDLRQRFADNYLDSPIRDTISPAAAGEEVLQTQELTRFLYTGGLFLALALDREIGLSTGQERNLDDLMIRLARRAERAPGFQLTRASLEEELTALTQRDFGPWLSRHVYGTETPELPEFVLAR